MIKSLFKSKQSKFVLISFIFVIASTIIVYLFNTSQVRWFRMIWNYFLAVVPLYMALSADYFSKRDKTPPTVLFLILWLLFFPNCIYLLTDFKYLSDYDFETWSVFNVVSDNVVPWILLINLVICIFSGVLVGMMSLDSVHKILRRYCGDKTCILIIVAFMIASSFGVYIGRFARLNSWDIVNPEKLCDGVLSVMTPFTPVFMLMFTIITLILYAGYYFLKRIIKS